MKRADAGPVLDAVPGLRQRKRADGTWRLWWEPTRAQRAAGAATVDLSDLAPGDAARKARRLAKDVLRNATTRPAPVYVAARSVSATILDYTASLRFERLAENTKAGYRSLLKQIDEKWGAQPIVMFDKPVIDGWYETLFRTRGSFQSLALIRAFSIVFRHAEKRGWRAAGSNPCSNPDTVRPKGRSRVGSWAELDACLQAARRMGLRQMRLAIMLATFGGQRQTDVLAVVPGDFETLRLLVPGSVQPRTVWVWSLVRSKRGNAGQVPVHPMIVPALRVALMTAHTGPGTLIWDHATGAAFTKRLFWDRWDAIRTEAAKTVPSVRTLQWRDLRRTFAHLSRRGGASKSDVADILGNTADTNAQLTDVYMSPQLATSIRAVDAIARPTAMPTKARVK